MNTRAIVPVTLIGLASAVALPLAPIQAAVRICSAPLVSIPARAATEKDAKKLALADWTSKAATAGYPQTHWRIAVGKTLKCLNVGDAFECVAVASACRIEQAPDKLKKRVPLNRQDGAPI